MGRIESNASPTSTSPRTSFMEKKKLNDPIEKKNDKKSQKGLRRKSSTKHAGSTMYIQMQLCLYNDLRVFIENRAGTVNSALNLEILWQILSGLAHIHAQSIVHRDLKPENVSSMIVTHLIARSLWMETKWFSVTLDSPRISRKI